jgi:hypothetical protein
MDSNNIIKDTISVDSTIWYHVEKINIILKIETKRIRRISIPLIQIPC